MGQNILNILLGVGQIIAGAFLLATGAGAAVGARLLLSGGLTLISSFMPRKSGEGWRTSSRYGFDNAMNVTNVGGVRPVVFGRERVAPPIISANLVQEGDKQALWLLCLLSEGEIDSVHDIAINDTPLEEAAFPGSFAIVKRGTPDQAAEWKAGGGPDGEGGDTVVRGFNVVARPYDAQAQISKSANAPFVYQMKDEADALTLNFVWHGGLYAVDNGDRKQASCRVRIEHKRAGDPDSAYKAFPVPEVGRKRQQGSWVGTAVEGEWKTEAKDSSALRRQIRLDFAVRGAYTVKVAGTEDDDTSGTYQARRVPNIEGVIEQVNDARAYPGRALLGLKVYAGETLSGNIPRVTCTVKGVKCLDPRDGTRRWTRNPVLIAREVLTNPEWGMGHRFAAEDLDEGPGGTWRTMADACDASVSPLGQPSEARFMCDLVLDQRAEAMDWITQILGACRMSLSDTDGKVRVVFDDAATGSPDVVAEARAANTTTRHNVVRAGDETSSLEVRTLPESERVNILRARFTDETDGYRQAVLSVHNKSVAIGTVVGTPTPGEEIVGATSGAICRYVWHEHGTLHYVQDAKAALVENGEVLRFVSSGAETTTAAAPRETPEVERIREIQLWGVTRPTQVLRNLRYDLNQSLMCPHLAVMGAPVGDVNVEPGDVVDVSDDVHAFAAKRFRVLDVARDDTGTVQWTLREHRAAVYADMVDALPTRQRYADPIGAVPPGLREPTEAGATVGTSPPAAAPPPAATSSPPPSSSTTTSVTPKPTFGLPSSKLSWLGFK